MTHPFLDTRQDAPRASEIKSLGMASRIRTLQRAAGALPWAGPYAPADLDGFLARLDGFDADRMAVVGHMLGRTLRVGLLHALHAQGQATWTPAESLRLLLAHQHASPPAGMSGPPHSQALHEAIWGFAHAHAIVPVLLEYETTLAILPLAGWVWLGEEAARDPHTALGWIHQGHLHTQHLSGMPVMHTPAEHQAYGRAMGQIYAALYAVQQHSAPRPHPLAGMLPGLSLSRFEPLLHIEDLAIAALAGWPLDSLIRRAQDLPYDDSPHGWRWGEAVSAHGRMALAAELHALTEQQRHQAIAVARRIDTCGLFDNLGKAAIFCSDPVLRRIFVHPDAPAAIQRAAQHLAGHGAHPHP